MPNSLIRCFNLFVLSLLLASPIRAGAQKTYAIGLGGGPSMPVGRLSDSQKTGYNATALLAIGAPEFPLGLRFDATFNQFSRRDILLPQGGGAGAYSFRALGGTANLVYTFPGTTAKPYVLAGAGVYSTKLISADSKAERDWGFNAGVGATFGLGPFGTFIESRYHSISRSVEKGGVIHFVPVTIGLLF